MKSAKSRQVTVTPDRRLCSASRSGSSVVRLKRPDRSVATAEVLARDLAAKGQPLQVKEARSALHIGQGFGVDIDQAVEVCLRGDLESQHVEEGDIVLLQHPEQVVDVAAAIIDELCVRTSCPSQEDARPCRQRARHRCGGWVSLSISAQMRLARLRLPPSHGATGRTGMIGERVCGFTFWLRAGLAQGCALGSGSGASGD